MQNKFLSNFDKRELRLIRNCLIYANNDPAGLPGHNLAIIIAKLMDEFGIDLDLLDLLIKERTENG